LLLGKVWSYYSNVLFELLLGDKQIFFPGRRGKMLPTLSCLAMKQTARAQAETTEDGPCRGLHIRKPNVHVNEEWA